MQTYDYDSFGNPKSTTQTITQPYTYTAREYDPETGLYFYRARQYDAKTGRFLQKDPIGFSAGDVNQYRYVGNSPTNATDPSGLFGEGLKAGGKYLGHSDFSGSAYFDYNREDRGDTQPVPIIGEPERHFRNLPVSEAHASAAIASCYKDGFERAMHRGQDYYTHDSKGYKWKPGDKKLPCNGYGHSCDGTKPDQDKDAWEQAEDWTRRWLKKWNERCGCRGW